MSLAKMFSTIAVAFAFALTPVMAEEVARELARSEREGE